MLSLKETLPASFLLELVVDVCQDERVARLSRQQNKRINEKVNILNSVTVVAEVESDNVRCSLLETRGSICHHMSCVWREVDDLEIVMRNNICTRTTLTKGPRSFYGHPHILPHVSQR